jgi:hypothetical protein
MEDKYKQLCVFFFFYSWTFFLHIFPCSNIVSCQSFIRCIELPSPSLTQWNTMLKCMTSFSLEKQIPHTSIVITCNNDVVWSMSWTPLSLTCWWFLALHHSIEQGFFPWEWMNLKVGYDPSIFHIRGGII